MKSTVFVRFFKKISLLSVLLFVLAFVMTQYLPVQYITPVLPYIVLFFYLISLTIYYLLTNSIQKRFNQFLNYFMLATTVKLVLMFVIMVVYVLNFKEDAYAFMVSFFLLYVIYTFIEVVSLLSFNKSLKK